jgi:mycofactocin system FadH/OYE family oxidoreductase 1
VGHDVCVNLLEPLVIGTHEAPSQVVLGPHETNLGERRAISERHVAYYRRRAAGGAGVVTVEEASVHDSDWPYERAPLAADCSPGWAAVADVCHAEGALVLAALGHAGGQGTSHWSQRELWSPSRVPEVNTREVPKWMEEADISAVVAGFAAAAGAAVAAGCDGVDVNAGQYSLVRQFLSGLTNQRDDQWGADRLLFVREVLRAVRAAIGPDAILGLRLSCDELAPWAGVTPEQAPELAASIVSDESSVDLLTVVRGSIYSTSATRPDGHTPPGFNLELTRSVRDAVRTATDDRVLVVAQGSIVDTDQAEWAITDGIADAVEMTRAQLSDAELVAKLRRGEATRIRPCTLSNQRSQVRDNRNPIVSSLGDPFTGHETEDQPVEGTALHPRDFVVVGGGPAGLEAARVAALRGHSVTLYEASDRFGGMMRTAAKGPGWARMDLLADWLVGECRHLGVELVSERPVTAETLTGATHVIVATGGQPGTAGYAIDEPSMLRHATQVLDDPSVLPEGEVLIWDPIGGPIGVAVAELLVAEGRRVHLATQDNIVGNELARSGDLAPANSRLQQAGVELHRRSILRSVQAGSATFEDRFNGARRDLEIAVVIDAGHRLPDEKLWLELAGNDALHVQRAGDCVAPRTVYDAILEGRRAALALG